MLHIFLQGKIMRIRHTTIADLPRIMKIFEIAKIFMRVHGNHHQWTDGYPAESVLLNDIDKGWSHVITTDDGDRILGTFCLMTEPEPTYSLIDGNGWLNERPYVTIHRIASDDTTHGLLKNAVTHALATGCDIRIDTHADNHPMHHAVKQLGFTRCGIITLADGSLRTAYHLVNTSAHSLPNE